MTASGAPGPASIPPVGFVVIGRNEGARLDQSLQSVLRQSPRVIYADSASTDGSVALARVLGVKTIVLDDSAPLTAARGRNAGYRALRENFPACEFVQFLDGDCILAPEWVEQALEFLRSNPRAAVACGRRFEANPEASVYNRLCDEEWNTPVGQAEAGGGDALIRVSALEQVGGFRPELKAGEEPEMMARMRHAGWEIWRLDVPMTEHDARIVRFGQWWRRALRGGYGYAQVWSTTRSLPRRLYGRQLRSAFIWTAGVPLVVCLASLALEEPLLLLALPLAYLVQIARIAYRRGSFSLWSVQSAALILLAKLPEAAGALRYFAGHRPDRLGEYKARRA